MLVKVYKIEPVKQLISFVHYGIEMLISTIIWILTTFQCLLNYIQCRLQVKVELQSNPLTRCLALFLSWLIHHRYVYA